MNGDRVAYLLTRRRRQGFGFCPCISSGSFERGLPCLALVGGFQRKPSGDDGASLGRSIHDFSGAARLAHVYAQRIPRLIRAKLDLALHTRSSGNSARVCRKTRLRDLWRRAISRERVRREPRNEWCKMTIDIERNSLKIRWLDSQRGHHLSQVRRLLMIIPKRLRSSGRGSRNLDEQFRALRRNPANGFSDYGYSIPQMVSLLGLS